MVDKSRRQLARFAAAFGISTITIVASCTYSFAGLPQQGSGIELPQPPRSGFELPKPPGYASSSSQTHTPLGYYEGKRVMDPNKYFGKEKLAYMAAQRIPDVLAHLFCYCGCDVQDGHTSLLDCYTSDHGSSCSTCTGEALLALQMKTEGKSLREIQREVDAKFSSERVDMPMTDALTDYRKSIGAPTSDRQSGSDAQKQGSKPKASKKAPGCCGHDGK